jgi:hypothetical protein
MTITKVIAAGMNQVDIPSGGCLLLYHSAFDLIYCTSYLIVTLKMASPLEYDDGPLVWVSSTTDRLEMGGKAETSGDRLRNDRS